MTFASSPSLVILAASHTRPESAGLLSLSLERIPTPSHHRGDAFAAVPDSCFFFLGHRARGLQKHTLRCRSMAPHSLSADVRRYFILRLIRRSRNFAFLLCPCAATIVQKTLLERRCAPSRSLSGCESSLTTRCAAWIASHRLGWEGTFLDRTSSLCRRVPPDFSR